MGFDLQQNIIKDINTIAEKYIIKKVVLFGSRARGDNKNTSDIDLAIYVMNDFDDKGSFTLDIEDIETLLKFDIVFIDNNSDEKLIENIEKDGVVIHERK